MNENNVAAFRAKNKISQEELGKAVNVTSDYISMIERGVRTPGFKLAKEIADYFGTTIDEIFFGI